MGFRQGAVLATVCFFLGVLFNCFNVDHKVLFGVLTDAAVDDGFQFYTTFFNAPPAIKALLHGLMGAGVVSLIAKLHAWTESAMFFDGTSLGAYVFGVAVYATVTVPALRTIVEPLADETRAVRAEALRVLGAGNVIIAVCMGAVLVLQGGQEYVARVEARDAAAAGAAAAAAGAAEKKAQ